jgi:hypothetical protein
MPGEICPRHSSGFVSNSSNPIVRDEGKGELGSAERPPSGATGLHSHGNGREAVTKRKTGVYVPNVETVALVRDERGWLRLAG